MGEATPIFLSISSAFGDTVIISPDLMNTHQEQLKLGDFGNTVIVSCFATFLIHDDPYNIQKYFPNRHSKQNE